MQLTHIFVHADGNRTHHYFFRIMSQDDSFPEGAAEVDPGKPCLSISRKSDSYPRFFIYGARILAFAGFLWDTKIK